MGSDKASFGPPLVIGNNFSISIEATGRGQCDELFAKLSNSGSVIMPLQEMFWGAYFGSCTDRFGINWMVNYTLPTGVGVQGSAGFRVASGQRRWLQVRKPEAPRGAA